MQTSHTVKKRRNKAKSQCPLCKEVSKTIESKYTQYLCDNKGCKIIMFSS